MKKAHATKTWAMPVAKQWQGRHGPGKWHLYCWDPFKQKRRRSYDAGGWSAHGKPWYDSQREADLDCDRYRQWLSGELKASLAGRPVGSRPSVFPSENRAANASTVTTCASASPTLPLLQTADPAHIPGSTTTVRGVRHAWLDDVKRQNRLERMREVTKERDAKRKWEQAQCAHSKALQPGVHNVGHLNVMHGLSARSKRCVKRNVGCLRRTRQQQGGWKTL